MYCFGLQKVLGQRIDCRFAVKIPPCFEELIIDDLNGISSVTDLESNLCTSQCRSLSGRVRKSTVKIRLFNLSEEAIIDQKCMREMRDCQDVLVIHNSPTRPITKICEWIPKVRENLCTMNAIIVIGTFRLLTWELIKSNLITSFSFVLFSDEMNIDPWKGPSLFLSNRLGAISKMDLSTLQYFTFALKLKANTKMLH